MEVAGGPVGRVAEVVDGLQDPGQGVGAEQVGVVDRVRDGLARDARTLGDVGERGGATGSLLVMRPAGPLGALDTSPPRGSCLQDRVDRSRTP